mmetsp:Transcript_110469/g.323159  ORF Transcript_110469/g.323159 Transcript_110469/m.323159 type:complete len:184 (-) Transcript_110469:11-562(-)
MARDGQPSAAQLAALDRRVAVSERRLGVATEGATVSERLADLQKRVEEVFGQDTALQGFEQGMEALNAWLEEERAATSRVLMHAATKRNFVVQQAAQLQEIVRLLEQVQRLERFAGEPAPAELGGQGERLRRIEARSAATAGSAIGLHQHVTQVAEDYHKTIVSLNAQLLHWDQVLSRRQQQC